MSVLMQLLLTVAFLVAGIGLIALVSVLVVGRGTRRPREDAALQEHQQSARARIGGNGPLG